MIYLQKVKKIMAALIIALTLFMSVGGVASAKNTTCSMSFKRGYVIGGTRNYFDWVIKPGVKVVRSSGYNVGYGIGCSAGGVFKKSTSTKSTHFYTAVTNLSLCAAYYIGANFATYHRDSVSLFKYNSYMVHPLDKRY